MPFDRTTNLHIVISAPAMRFNIKIEEHKHDRASLRNSDCPVALRFSVVGIRVVWWQEPTSGARKLCSTTCESNREFIMNMNPKQSEAIRNRTENTNCLLVHKESKRFQILNNYFPRRIYWYKNQIKLLKLLTYLRQHPHTRLWSLELNLNHQTWTWATSYYCKRRWASPLLSHRTSQPAVTIHYLHSFKQQMVWYKMS